MEKTGTMKGKKVEKPVPVQRYKWIAIFVLGLAIMVLLLGAVKMLVDLNTSHPVAFWTILTIAGGAIAGGLTWLIIRLTRKSQKTTE